MQENLIKLSDIKLVPSALPPVPAGADCPPGWSEARWAELDEALEQRRSAAEVAAALAERLEVVGTVAEWRAATWLAHELGGSA